MRRIPGSTRIAALTLMAATTSMAAAAPVDEVVTGTPHQSFFAVAFEGGHGFAAGGEAQGGALLRHTEDGGQTWTAEVVPTRAALLGVGVGGDHRIVVGQEGMVMVRDADGKWQEVEAVTPERLMNADANAAGRMVAVGAFGALLVSDDAGATWRDAAPDWSTLIGNATGGGFGPNLYAADVADDGVITVAGEWGAVMRSTDGGDTWSLLHVGDTEQQQGDASMFGMHVGDDGLILTVGQEGSLLRSTDAGENWERRDSGTHANLLSVAATSGGRMVATGMREMLISEDAGLSWERVDASDFLIGWYSGAASPRNSEMIYVVGHSGRIVAIDTDSVEGVRLQQ